MDIEQIFVDSQKAAINDETDSAELNLSISPWNESEIEEVEENTHQKCGEVHLTNKCTLIFVCIRCNWKFLDLPSFADHIAEGPCEQDANLLNSGISKELDEEISHTIIERTLELEDINSCPDSIEKDNSFDQDPALEIHSNCQSPQSRGYSSAESTSISYQSEFEQKVTDQRNCIDSNFIVTAKRKRNPLKKELKVEEMPFCAACTKSFAIGFRIHLGTKHLDLFSKEEIKNDSIESLENRIVQTLDEMECIYCNLVFTTLEEFRLHAGMHLGRNLYVCKFCPKKFHSQFNRRVHMNIHEDSRPYKCTHCPKAFNNPNNLQKHIKIHLNNHQFACSICKRGCTTDSERKVHERWHTNEKPFQCEECGKRFVTRLLFRYHKLRHRGIKNFKCSFCDKAFYSMSLLKSHLPKHTKERKFKCEICDETFPRRNALTQHKLLHEAIKRYRCNVCGREFAQYAGLYTHRKIHGQPLSKGLCFI